MGVEYEQGYMAVCRRNRREGKEKASFYCERRLLPLLVLENFILIYVLRH
ncbi:hypothetical protein HMPREF9446_00695 [Bacteroides fluxus YIT 12057]|uniref:Uncharacterized protein n=1 Tax=Bacteroides fluxus YIT 12057 TaxID=763034 RepID=F3PPQ3_9BACE|nr:hypothetical protein HMPREF9446_00695 [Bacteroides fluxus YIT 12057]